MHICEESAWSTLWRQHAAYVYRVVHRVVRDDDLAADVSQDVWLAAWTHRRTYRGAAAPRTWLHRIAYTRALNAARDRDTRLRYTRALTTAHERTQRSHRDPFLAAHIDQALASLPTEQRAVFTAYALSDSTYCDIADRHARCRATMRSQVLRARVRLRQILAHLEREVS